MIQARPIVNQKVVGSNPSPRNLPGVQDYYFCRRFYKMTWLYIIIFFFKLKIIGLVAQPDERNWGICYLPQPQDFFFLCSLMPSTETGAIGGFDALFANDRFLSLDISI